MTEAAIRSYRPADHSAARALWVEFVEQHRELYGTPQTAGDPGAAFEEYLTRLDLSGLWVAEDPSDGVVGLIGLDHARPGRRGGADRRERGRTGARGSGGRCSTTSPSRPGSGRWPG